MKELYLKRLYRTHKPAFALVMLFLSATLITSLFGDEVTPFFVWGMFSAKENPQLEQEVIEIQIDGKPFNYFERLPNFNRHMLVGACTYYAALLSNQEDPTRSFLKEKLGGNYNKIQGIFESISNETDIGPEFEAWMKRYISSSTGELTGDIEVLRKTYRYSESHSLELIRTDTIPGL